MTTVCDGSCHCDPECQCDCDLTTICDDSCGCDPECNAGCALLGPTTKGALGDAYAGLGDMDNALSNYEAAADMDDNEFTTPIFLFKAGLAAEEVGDYDRAVRLYGKLDKDYSESREGRDAAKYLARAEAKL